MEDGASMCHFLEDLLYDEITEPLCLKLSLLQGITSNFSEEQVIGSGAHGEVYKGEVGDSFVAVKKFYSFCAIEDETFQREVDCLMRIKHRNIVQFVGYCAEMHVEVVRQGPKNLFAESRAKLLCFEYLHNGSLRRHLTDKPCGLQWHICYQIIKGICRGLHYLHEKNIIHLDLKPDNILLDDGMVPKIADFGLSRLLGEGKSRTVTRNNAGTIGYMAPEYLDGGAITTKSDIYSLGVIIRDMVIGRHKMGAPTGNALESWKTRLELDASHMRHIPLEVGYQQVEACIEISRRCTDTNPDNRPATLEILHKLEETETVDETCSPLIEQIRSMSKLMNDLKLMAVTFSRQPSTRVERYKVFSPVPSLSTPPTNKILWVDSTSGADCYLLSSRSLRITWGDTPGHWRWISLPNSRFAECAELLGVHWLAIIGEIPPKDLTMDTPYAAYLVYNLASGTSGLQGVQTSSLRLYGERVVATSRVSVDPATCSEASDVAYPIERDDGWMELKLAEFTNDERMLAEAAVIVDFREVNDHVKKSGLIVEGLEFRPQATIHSTS